LTKYIIYFILILYLNTTVCPLLGYPRILLDLRVGDTSVTRRSSRNRVVT